MHCRAHFHIFSGILPPGFRQARGGIFCFAMLARSKPDICVGV